MVDGLDGLRHLLTARPWFELARDVLDIIIVTYVIYRALLVLRGTRAMQMGTGLGVIFLVYVVSKQAGFVTLVNLLSTLLSSIILIVVVVFQNDIRRGLMRVGSRAFLGGISRQQESRVIDEVVGAATELARHRVGALICFEQDANLDEFVVAQGTNVDSAVQRDLLVTLFVPDSLNKLHDGAVVIRNLRIAKAGVFFPMPDTKLLDKSLGSRHRAALGVTEETDAVVVVVSEERGTISFCFNGNIVPNLDGVSLKQALLGLFGQRARGKKKAAADRKRNSTTGSFRLTIPPGGPATSSTTGSFTLSRTSIVPDAPPTKRQRPTPADSFLPPRRGDEPASASGPFDLPRRALSAPPSSEAPPERNVPPVQPASTSMEFSEARRDRPMPSVHDEADESDSQPGMVSFVPEASIPMPAASSPLSLEGAASSAAQTVRAATEPPGRGTSPVSSPSQVPTHSDVPSSRSDGTD